jgi:hypothetical protein
MVSLELRSRLVICRLDYQRANQHIMVLTHIVPARNYG